MAIYICYKCKFGFERVSEPDRCPDCGYMNVRLADEEEIQEYRRNREEVGHGSVHE